MAAFPSNLRNVVFTGLVLAATLANNAASAPDNATGTTADGDAAYQAKDYARALQIMTPLARAGDPDAQNTLGVMSELGAGVPMDKVAAFNWYQKSAVQGYDWGEYDLGMLYQEGEGVTRDYTAALAWLMKAAAQQNSWAMREVGQFYENGWGIPIDDVQAVSWYQRSAALGFSKGQAALAYMYEHGLGGLTTDLAKARELYTDAANQGDDEGKDWLAAHPR